MKKNPSCFCGKPAPYPAGSTDYCARCGSRVEYEDGPAPAGPCGSIPSGDVAVAEVRKLAERVTVLEGMVGELRRTVAELLRAPATAAPSAPKGYWR